MLGKQKFYQKNGCFKFFFSTKYIGVKKDKTRLISIVSKPIKIVVVVVVFVVVIFVQKR